MPQSNTLQTQQLDEKDWKTLTHALKYNKCIVILGAGVAAAEVDGQWQPLTKLLANELAEELNAETVKFNAML